MGLQGRFDEARALLDPLAAHEDPVVLARVRLERGRLLNSSGAAAESIPLFTGALDVAAGAGEDFLAADAAHMLAIVDGDRASAWTDRALAIVRASADPRVARWAGPLYTNSGWSRHEAADFPGALRDFGDALAAYTRHGTAEQVRIAQWSVARALRSVGRFDEALEIQRLLAAAGPDDGYVFEELAELGVARRTARRRGLRGGAAGGRPAGSGRVGAGQRGRSAGAAARPRDRRGVLRPADRSPGLGLRIDRLGWGRLFRLNRTPAP